MQKVKKLIQTARLTGHKLGLPGERKTVPLRSIAPTPASQPLFAQPARIIARDYELPDPFAEKHIPISEDNLGYVDQRGFFAVNIEGAQNAFAEYGFDVRDLKSGRTYLFISETEFGQTHKPVYKRYHEHVGGNYPSDREFMVSLAAHESERFQEVHGRNRANVNYHQHMIVVPPHDPDTGKIPWFEHKSGFGWEFNWFLYTEKSWQRMGTHKAQQLLHMKTNWQDLESQHMAQPVDYMKAVRRSCGDTRNVIQPVP